MDSSNYSQTYNIQDIIDKIEEETNLTVPSAVIIPLKQHRTVNLNANDTFEIDVKLMTRKRIFKKISIQPAEIENPILFTSLVQKVLVAYQKMNGTFARKFTISYRRILTRNVFTVLLVNLITNTFLVITSSRQLQQTLLKMYFLEVLVQSNMRVQTSFLKSIFHASKVRQRVSSFCLPCF